MRKIIKLTESDLTRIVKRVIMEQDKNPLAFTTDPNYMDYDGFNKSSEPDEPLISNSDLASVGYTDTSEDTVDFHNFMVDKGFQIINRSENIDNEIPSTDSFYPRYEKTMGDYTIYVILKLKNPRQTSKISIYDSEGLVAGEDIKNVEEKGVDPKWGDFTSYKIDYNQLKDSLINIMNKYKTVEENYRRRYRRY
jgi:hypothetical protein